VVLIITYFHMFLTRMCPFIASILRDFYGNSAELNIDVVVWIDSKKYHGYPYNQKALCAV